MDLKRHTRIRVAVLESPLVAECSISAAIVRTGRFMLVQSRPLVAVIDANTVGDEVARLVGELRSGGARVLVLSSSVDRERVDAALRAGAEGFLVRLQTWAQLMQSIRTLAAGRNAYGPEVASVFADSGAEVLQVIDGQTWELDPVRLDLAGSDEAAGARGMALSPREAQILQQVATGHSNAAIAQLLHISAHTVRKHRENLMAKLGLHNVAEVTAFAVRNNLIVAPAMQPRLHANPFPGRARGRHAVVSRA